MNRGNDMMGFPEYIRSVLGNALALAIYNKDCDETFGGSTNGTNITMKKKRLSIDYRDVRVLSIACAPEKLTYLVPKNILDFTEDEMEAIDSAINTMFDLERGSFDFNKARYEDALTQAVLFFTMPQGTIQ